MNAGSIFRTNRVSLGYGELLVLSEVSWEVGRGEYWCVLGPNGSGKTTLLRALLGMLEPLSGGIDADPGVANGARVGYVPQKSQWRASLPTTLSEFVRLGQVGSDLDAAARAESRAWALERVGMSALREHSVADLSGGQMRRALLARALARRPTLLVLDEPTEGLDLPSHEGLLGTLDRLNREDGLTLIVVTHQLDVAARHASHVALVSGGRLRTGTREALMRDEVLSEVFGRRLGIGSVR